MSKVKIRSNKMTVMKLITYINFKFLNNLNSKHHENNKQPPEITFTTVYFDS